MATAARCEDTKEKIKDAPAAITIEEFDSAVTQTIEILKREYYKEFELTEDTLTATIRGLLSSLDEPYSRYIPSKTYWKSKNQDLETYGGVGVSLDFTEDGVMVFRTVENSAASKAGIAPGDFILEVEGVEAKAISKEELHELFAGEIGSDIKLKVKKGDSERVEEFVFKRCILHTVDAEGEMLEGSIGRLKISEFGSHVYAQTIAALEDLSKSNLKGLIIDMRYNPGGLAYEAALVSDIFIEKGPVMVLEDRDPKKNTTLYAKTDHSIPDVPIVLLVNKYTASAAEIVTAALKHYRNFPVLGETTFGKGLSQRHITMADGSVLSLTTARVMIAGELDINDKGVSPDFEIVPEKGTDEEIEDLQKLTAAQKEKLPDPVLDKAAAFVIGLVEKNESSGKRSLE
ncbi:MAG TPA: S41 family peptidase [bacterium]|nr:S41 family peptidase [bacterium]HPI77990.1 S41 family peptidase [bacterium]